MIFSENCKVIINDLAQRFGIIIDWASEDLQISIQNLFQKFANWQIKLT